MKQNVNMLKNWDGFISNDGIFYKFQKWNEERTPDDVFVEAFAHDKLIIDSKKLLYERGIRADVYAMSFDDVLVNLLGFISYRKNNNTIEIMYPDYEHGPYTITDCQLETLNEVIRVNNNENIKEKVYTRKR